MKKKPSLISLINVLEEKQEILQDLLELTARQKEILSASDDQMNQKAHLSLIEERNRIMEVIDELDKGFLKDLEKAKVEVGCQALDQVPSGTFEADQVKNLQNVTKNIQLLLNEVVDLDNENREFMKSMMVKMKSEINQIQKGKKAIHGYANTKQQQPSIFMDKKEKDHRK